MNSESHLVSIEFFLECYMQWSGDVAGGNKFKWAVCSLLDAYGPSKSSHWRKVVFLRC